MDFRAVDIRNIVIPPLKQKEKGGKSSVPLYKNPQTGATSVLCIQTPVCRLPFGLSEQVQDDGTIRYSISGSFDEYRTNALMRDFHKFCSDLEDYMIHTAAHNSVDWFGEETDAKTCRRLTNLWVKISKDKQKAEKYDPTFKAMVRQAFQKQGGGAKDANNTSGNDGNNAAGGGGAAESKGPALRTELHDTDGKVIDIHTLEPGSRGSMKIKLTSVYLIAGRFGFTWEAEWVKLAERASQTTYDYVENMYGQTPTFVIPAMSAPEPGPSEIAAAEEQVPAPSKRREREEGNESNPSQDTTAPPVGTQKRVKKANH